MKTHISKTTKLMSAFFASTIAGRAAAPPPLGYANAHLEGGVNPLKYISKQTTQLSAFFASTIAGRAAAPPPLGYALKT